MKDYREKFEYLANRNGWVCPICKSRTVTDMHHARIHNTSTARKLYPLFLDSILNFVLLCNPCHLSRPSYGKWSELRVSKYEKFLERHNKISEWVNSPECQKSVW